MKGVILAGGKGTRLLPATRVTNKHLIPILNKPMVLYPLETLRVLGVREVLLVTGGEHVGDFANFLGDGSEVGVELTYRVQKEAGGIAQALGLAKQFVGRENALVILGDNIFDNEQLAAAGAGKSANDEARLFLKEVADPRRFGVPLLERGKIVDIEEKPLEPRSRYAVTGLYEYPPDVFNVLRMLKPSERGELEITDVNNFYAHAGRCRHTVLPGFWSDAGTPESLFRATQWVMQNRRLDEEI